MIEQFWYPKYGPGQLWETLAEKIEEKGGKIQKGYSPVDICINVAPYGSAMLVLNLKYTGAGTYDYSKVDFNEITSALKESIKVDFQTLESE